MNWFAAGLMTGGTIRTNSLPSLVMPIKESVAM